MAVVCPVDLLLETHSYLSYVRSQYQRPSAAKSYTDAMNRDEVSSIAHLIEISFWKQCRDVDGISDILGINVLFLFLVSPLLLEPFSEMDTRWLHPIRYPWQSIDFHSDSRTFRQTTRWTVPTCIDIDFALRLPLAYQRFLSVIR